MTTKHSHLNALKVQADKIASTLIAAERGDKIDARFAVKLAAARSQPSFKVGIVMDDQVITLDLPWSVIRETSFAGLSAYIVKQMRGAQNDA